jgi:hypothetical protein
MCFFLILAPSPAQSLRVFQHFAPGGPLHGDDVVPLQNLDSMLSLAALCGSSLIESINRSAILNGEIETRPWNLDFEEGQESRPAL